MTMSRAVAGLSFVFALSIGALVGALAAGGGQVVGPAGPPPLLGSSRGPSFADIVERVNPAVVHIAVLDGPGTTAHEDTDDAEDAAKLLHHRFFLRRLHATVPQPHIERREFVFQRLKLF